MKSKTGLLGLFILISCSVTKSSIQQNKNVFASPFRLETPAALQCDDFEQRCDTSFYIPDSIILNLIDSRKNKFEISSNCFLDTRIKFRPTNNSMNTICVDASGKMLIGNVCYKVDTLILKMFLSYLPKHYR